MNCFLEKFLKVLLSLAVMICFSSATWAADGQFNGTIIDANSLKPLSGVLVQVFKGSKLVTSETTNDQGVYLTSSITQGGKYDIVASLANYQTATANNINFRNDDSTTQNFQLIKQGALTGLVSDALTSAPLLGASVQALQGTTLIAAVTTEKDGSYTFDNLNPGTYTLSVTLSGFQSSSQTTKIITNQTGSVNLILTPQAGTVSGKVTNSQTNAVISGATVTVLQNKATILTLTTPSTGNYSIITLLPGNYTVRISATNFQTFDQAVTVQSNQTQTVNANLVPLAGVVSGTITNTTNNAALPGVTVSALQGTTVISSGTTGTDGTYTISNLAPGSYTVTATLTNFQTGTKAATINSNQTTTTSLSLNPQPGTIRGNVTHSLTGVALSGATITILQGSKRISTTSSAVNGDYSLSNLLPGIYTVRVSVRNFDPLNQTTVVQSNLTNTVNAALVPQAGTLSGKVTNGTTKAALSGVSVSAMQGTMVVKTATTKANGTYTMTALAPGSYTVKATHTNFQTNSQSASISSNQKTKTNLALTPQSGTIAGSVTNSQTAEALKGATITILQGTVTINTATSAANGSYSVANLVPGSYTVRISATNFQTSNQTIFVVASQTATANASLVRVAGIVSGTVKNMINNASLEGVAVSVLQGTTVISSTTSAANGTYTLINLAPGSYTLKATLTNFQTNTQAITVSSNQTTTVGIFLSLPPGTIAGIVKHSQTAAFLSGATISILQGSTTVAVGTSAANGTYTITNLVPGSYTVSTSANNFQTATQSATVQTNLTTTVNVNLTPQPGAVWGVVTSALTGSPLAGATVSISQEGSSLASTTTATNGSYTLSALTQGTYTLIINLENYQATRQTITISSNQTTTANESLTPLPGNISGKIRATILPLSGAKVKVLKGTVVISTATTSWNGGYSLNLLPPGEYSLTASATNYQTMIQSVTVLPNQTTTANLNLQCQPGTVTGQITTSNGTPIPSASVNILQNNVLVGSATTAVNGSYSIQNLAPGKYTLTATALNFQTNTQPATVVLSQTTTVNISLQSQPGSINGQVTHAITGNPLSGAVVQALQNNVVMASILTSANGQFTLSSLASGAYVLQVSATSFQATTQPVNVIANEVTLSNFSLSPQPGQMNGKITDASNLSPIAHATVSVQLDNVVLASTQTDCNGNYSISNLAPNSYIVTINAANYQNALQGGIVSSNQNTTVNISLQPQPATITGSITDALNANPINGVTVDLLQSNIVIISTTTNSDGNYFFSGLTPGVYTIRATIVNYEIQLQSAAVQSNQTATNHFTLLPSTGLMSGIVRDALTSFPLANATINVSLNNLNVASTTTAIDGSFSFTDLATGNYTLNTAAANYQTATVGAAVLSNQTTTVNFLLNSEPGMIVGQISDAFSGNHLAGVNVQVLLNNILIATTLTDNHGNFTLNGLAPGGYIVVATANNYQTATQGAAVQANSSTSLTFGLQLYPGSIFGKVIDALTSTPLTSAHVDVLTSQTIVASTVTDTSGAYTINSLAPGNYVVRVIAADYQTATQGAIVLANQTAIEDFSLQLASGNVVGQVIDAITGNPLPGGTVVTLQGNTLTASTVTDGNGNYTIAGIAPGSYTVQANASNYQSASQGAIVVANQMTAVNFSLQSSLGSIVGQVININSGSSVAGASVEVLQSNIQVSFTQTDSNGNYAFNNLAPGGYILQASAANVQTLVQGITVQSNQIATLNFALQDQPGTLSGQLIDSANQQPVIGAEVDLLQNGNKVAFALTDSQGNYSIANLAPGGYTATTSLMNYQAKNLSVTIQANLTATLNFSLVSQPGSMAGQVVDSATRAPLVSATVNILQGTNQLTSILTDTNGNYLFSELAPGSYTLSVALSDYQTQTQGISVQSNQTSSLNFSLAAQPGRINGKVLSASDNTAVTGATVNVLQGSTLIASATTDNNGNYTIGGLAPGGYTLSINATNFQTSNQSVTVQGNQTSSVNISMNEQSGIMRGQVTDASIAAIVGAEIVVLQSNIQIASSLTDSNGQYYLTGIAPGSYNVRANATDCQTAVLGAIVTPNGTTSTDFTLQPMPGNLSGLIIDATTSSPIKGATIDILQSNVVIASVNSMSDGTYVVSGLAPMTYTTRVSATNCQTQLQSANIEANHTTQGDFSLLPSPGSMSGVITDGASSLPLTNATVEVLLNNTSIASGITANDGSYAFTGLSPGTYTISATAMDYQTANQGLAIVSNQATIVNLALIAQPGNILGQLRDASSGYPLAGANIQVLSNNILIATALTDSNGTFAINGVAPGTYIIVGSSNNYQTATQGVNVQAHSSVSLAFSLQLAPGSISGEVTDLPNGNPLMSAHVDVLANNTVISSTVTDTSGNYTINNLAPDSYVVRVIATDYQTATQGAIVLANQTISENFVLQLAPGTVAGQVVDAVTGHPLPGGTVVTLQGNTLTAATVTDGNGSYTIAGIAPGSYTVQANASNYQTAAQGAIVVANQTNIVNFALQSSPGSIAGQVTNVGSGAPLIGALVQVFQTNNVISFTQTDSNGNYTFNHLAPGNYILQATAANVQTFAQGVTVHSNQMAALNFSLQDQPGTLSGQLIDSATQQPLIGAEVDLLQNGNKVAFALTDSQGNYVIANLATGNYSLTASLTNYQMQNRGVTIQANQPTIIHFALFSEPGSIAGQVIDRATSNPLVSATVNVLQGTTIVTSILTEMNGYYLFSGLAPGAYTLNVNLVGYQTPAEGVSVISNQTSMMNFSLATQPGTINGLVLSTSDSSPVSSVVVTVLQGSMPIASTLTDINGQFTIGGLTPGNYTLSLSASQFQTSNQSVVVLANLTSTINVMLNFQTGTISGQVTDDSNVAIEGAEVVVLQSNVIVASSLTDTNGNYTITGITPGSYNVRANATDFQTALLGATVTPNGTISSNFILQSMPGNLTGLINNASTLDPINGATIDILQSNVVIASVNSLSDGTYVVSGLAPYTYTTRVSATNCQTQLQSSTILANHTTQGDFTLPPSPGTMNGVITDAVSLLPLTHATVEVLFNNTSIASGITALDGSYSFTGLAPGNYTINATATNYQTSNQGSVVLPNQVTTVNLALISQAGSLLGQLSDASSGEWISGANVQVFQSNILIATALTDGHGSFEMNGLAPGNYIIVATANDYQTATQGATVQANVSSSLTFSLELSPGCVIGQVTDTLTPNPVASAHIDILVNNMLVASTVTDTNGNYIINNLAPGSYVVRVIATDYQTATQGAIVIVNQITTENFTLQPTPGSLTGQVLDAVTGNPLPGGTLVTLQGNTLMLSTVTDANGNYSMGGIAPGSYTIQANASNYQGSVLGAIVIANQITTVNFALLASPGTMSGQVIYLASGQAIVGASIQLLQSNIPVSFAQTDSNGYYACSQLAPGTYTVQATAPNVQTLAQGVTVESNQTSTLNFSLQDQPGILSGQMIDDASQQPIVGAEVDVLLNGNIAAFTLTDSLGNYTISNLATGNYTATTRLTNYQTQSMGVSIQANQTTTQNFSLISQPGSMSGQVTDATTNVRLVSATVNVLQGTNSVSSTLTDTNGNYLFSGLAPGAYTLSVAISDYQTQNSGITVQANQTTSLNFSLVAQPGMITGQILSVADNTPVTGAAITVLQGATPIASATSDNSGNYTLNGLASGSYTLSISANNFQTSTQSVAVQANQTSTINVSLNFQAGTISGRVTDASSLPMVGAELALLQTNVIVASSTTDNSGNYTICGLVPGSYNIRANAPLCQTALIGATVTPNSTVSANFSLQPMPGSLSGLIIDFSTSQPISGVTIDVLQSNIVVSSANNGSDGTFMIAGLAPSTYTIRASAANFQTQLQSATIQSDQTTNNDFTLLPSPGSVSGVILDAASSLPLTEAIVEIFLNNMSIASNLVAADGSYSFSGLAPGNYSVNANATNYQMMTQGVAVLSNETATVNLALNSQPGNILGELVDLSTGAPIAGANIQLFLNNILMRTILTDELGNFSMSGLAPSCYVAVASANNYQTATQGVNVQATHTSSLAFSLQASPGGILGEVRDASTSDPINNAHVDALMNNMIVASTVTDASGNYVINNLAPGNYVVRVTSNDYQTSNQGAIVAANQMVIENVRLQSSPGTISGIVLDAITGAPLPGGTIVTLQGNTSTAATMTDVNGYYVMTGLIPGSYTVQANACKYQTAAQGAIVTANQTTTINFSLQVSPGSIAGQVTNQASGVPIIGALVQAFQSNIPVSFTQTDSNGNYVFNDLAAGNYVVQASASNLQTVVQGIAVQLSLVSILNFTLQDQPGALSGQVLDTVNQLSIIGAEVSVLQNGSMIAFTLTDSQGNYLIANLPTGSYTTTASAANFQTRSFSSLIQPNETTLLNFSLDSKPGFIFGQVVDALTFAPLAGVTINARQGSIVTSSVLTTDNGDYLLSGSSIGDYTVIASHTDFETQIQRTIVQSNQTSVANFTLSPQPGSLNGQISNGSKGPISGAEINLLIGGTLVASTFSDNEGYYDLSGLAPANYTLSVTATHYDTSVQSVVIQPNQATVLNAVLNVQTGMIGGQVVASVTGIPISGAIVSIFQSNILFASDITDANGNYTLTNLTEGAYVLRTSAGSYQVNVIGVTAQSHQALTVNIALQPDSGKIQGLILDSSTASPIGGVEIDVLQSNIVIASTTTISDGTYTVLGLSEGNYVVRASAINYQIQLNSATVQLNNTTFVDISLLLSPGGVFGVVSNDLDMPINGTIIEVLLNNILVASTTTGIDGSYSISNLAPGNYVIQANAVNFENLMMGAIVNSNQTAFANFILQAQPSSILGNVVDALGNPLAGITVVTFSNNLIVNSTLTDTNGDFAVNNLSPSHYIVQASSVNYQTATQGAITEAEQSLSLSFQLITQPGRIVGQVLDLSTGHPIVSAQVDVLLNNIFTVSVLTDTQGNYVVPNLAPGSYSVKASASGYETFIQGAIVEINQTVTENFSLGSSPGMISGKVIDALTQNSISSAIIVTLQNNAFVAEILTDGNGNYIISGLAPGNYNIRASASNYQTFIQGATVFSNQVTTENFTLQPELGNIDGVVTDSVNGSAVAGATIEIFQGNARIATTITDSNGYFLVTNLAPGNYTVNVSSSQFQSQNRSAFAFVNGMSTLNFTLDDVQGQIGGRVTDATDALANAPIVGALVSIYQGSTRLDFTITDSNGNYFFSGLSPGNYSLPVSAAGYQTQALGAIVEADQLTSVDFNMLTETGNLSGRVIDQATNLPIAGAEVDVLQGSTLLNFALTDSNGYYQIMGLAPGNYTVRASANGYQTQTIGAIIQVNQTTIVNFALLSQLGSAHGRVIDGLTLLPIVNAQVRVFLGSLEMAYAVTDSFGKFTVTGLAPGAYVARASATNYQTETSGLTIRTNRVTSLNFTLEDEPGSLNGQIIDTLTQTPIGAAEIDVLQGVIKVASTLSDSTGHYLVTGLAPGSYQVRVTADHFQTTIQEETVLANETTTVNFSLDSEIGMIVGQVTIQNLPIAGAPLDIFVDSKLFASAIADSNGMFVFTDLAPGTYQIVAYPKRFQSSIQERIVVANETTVVNFAIQKHSTLLNGKIKNRMTRKGIKGAKVEVLDDSIVIASVLTNQQGHYKIKTLPEGKYTISISAPSYKSKTHSFVISKGKKRLDFSLEINLSPPKHLVGKTVCQKSRMRRKCMQVIKWLPSPEPEVAEYRVYRNNKQVAKIPASDELQYRTKAQSESHIREKYKVVAVDEEGNASLPAEVTVRR